MSYQETRINTETEYGTKVYAELANETPEALVAKIGGNIIRQNLNRLDAASGRYVPGVTETVVRVAKNGGWVDHVFHG